MSADTKTAYKNAKALDYCCSAESLPNCQGAGFDEATALTEESCEDQKGGMWGRYGPKGMWKRVTGSAVRGRGSGIREVLILSGILVAMSLSTTL